MDSEGAPGARSSRNISAVVARASRLHAAREAVSDGSCALTFGDLEERARRLANALDALGIRPGDRVAVLLRNSPTWVEVFFGIGIHGATCVPVNILLTPAEVAALCHDAGVRAIVVDGAGAEAVAGSGLRPEFVVQVGRADGAALPGALAYDSLLEASPARTPAGPAARTPLALYYSSGTTGEPKAAVHSHDNVMWNSFHQVLDLGITPADRYLVVPSLSWAAGLHTLMLATLTAGGTNVIAPSGGLTIDRVVRLVVDHRITSVVLVPALLNQLMDSPREQGLLRGSRLRFAMTGSAPVPLHLIHAWHDAFPRVALLQAYGLSEFPTVATVLREEEAVEYAGWAGRPSAITQVAVAGADGAIRHQGEGEILLRSHATMRGYWRRPELTEETFVAGWMRTGDVGVLDEGGFLKVTGRTKDMIISGGLNVFPSEIEAVIHETPYVREVAVLGLPDERWGEVPVAVVVPHTGFDGAGLLALCRRRLAGYKVPRHVLLRHEALPRNPAGKVLKRELAPWVRKRLGAP